MEHFVVCSRGCTHWGAHGAAGLLLHGPLDRFLLVQRGLRTHQGGTWSVPGGAALQGEDPFSAALREAIEELGTLPLVTPVREHRDDHGGWAYVTVIADVSAEFEPVDLGPEAHPNTLCFEVEAGGQRTTLTGISVGGGAVEVREANGLPVELTGEYDTLLIVARDIPGTTATVTRLLAERGVNIAFLEVSREKRGRDATMIIQSDQPIPDEVLEAVQGYEWSALLAACRK